jgi:hypothetical protein
MKKTSLLAGCLLALGAQLFPVQADTAEPTAFEKALYDKARYQVVCKLNDDEFVSYCVTMDVGGDTLLKIHDEILTDETKLTDLLNQGLTNEHPEVRAVNAALKDLRTELAVKISEARKGLEVESKIAEETLTALSQYQK